MQERGKPNHKSIGQFLERMVRSDMLLWFFLVGGWLLIYATATLGLQRDSEEWLPIKLVARASADYSPRTTNTLKLARVDPKIIEAIKKDDAVEKAFSTPTLAVVIPAITPTPTVTPTPTATPGPLRVNVGGPYEGDEGSPIALTANNFNSVLSIVPGSVTYLWDLDDDGLFDDDKGPATDVTFFDEGEYPVAVRAVDLIGREASDRTIVTVNNVPPVVNIISRDTSAPEAFEIAFAATAEDPGHDLLLFEWDFGDGTRVNDTLQPRHRYEDDGDFTVWLRVSDNDGGFTEEQIAIEVRNEPPTVDAGPDKSTDEGQPVTLRGTASDPSDLDPLTYAWDLDYDGSNFNTDVQGNSATTTYPNGPEIKVAALRVRDDDGGETIDTVAVTVNNVPPTILSLAHDGPVGEGSPLTLSVEATDAGGDPLAYRFDWENNGFFDTSGQPAAHIWYDEGDYSVGVEVDDGDGGSVFTTTTVSIFNEPPVAVANADDVRFEGDSVRFDASDSSDPGINGSDPGDPANDILTYQWSFGDGSTGTGLETGHIYDDNNAYTATLTVTDDSGAADAASVNVTILNANPEANAGPDRTVDEAADVSLRFQGTATDPGAADTLSYAWDFDYDGNTFTVDATGPEVIWANVDLDGPRDYQVALRVRDDDYPYPTTDGGEIGEDFDTLLLTVKNLPPKNVNAGGPYNGEEGDTITLRGSASDVPGDTLTYEWDLDYNGSSFTPDASGQVVTRTWTSAGQYPVRLRVADESGAASFANTVVNINAVPRARASVSPAVALEGQPITFDGSGSSDPDGDPLTYSWNFGDGSLPATGITVTHAYADNGVYTATLTLRDADGSVDFARATVTTLNANPVVSAGPDRVISEGVRLDLTATASDPGPADTLSYAWDFNYDGSNFDQDSANRNTSVTYQDGPATFIIALRVRDDDYPYPTGGGGEIGEALDTMSVMVVNVPPIATIVGAPYNGVEGQPVTLRGSAADAGPDTQTYQWDLAYDGSNFSPDVTGETVTYTWPNGGLYTVALQVTDDDGGVSNVVSAQVNIDSIPTAAAGGPYSGDEGSTVVFDGSGSNDPDGDGLTYRWNFGDGSLTTTGITVTHVYTISGIFTATLRVNDGRGGTATDPALVTINNLPPVAVASANPALAPEGASISFDGQASTDPGASDTLTYVWNFGDGSPPVSGSNVSYAYGDNGDFTATLTVSDNDGASDTANVTVTIENVPPIAVANVSPNPTREGTSVTFDATGSSDQGRDDTLTYQWDFGDGTPGATGPTVSHRYADEGNYTLTLSVFDDDGASDTDAVTVTVRNAPPQAAANVSPNPAPEGTPVTFDATGSSDPGSGDTLTYEWDFGDGSTPVSGTNVTHSYDDNGLYTVVLTARDNDGAVDTDTVSLSIVNVAPTADAGGPYIATVGTPLTLTGSGIDIPADPLNFSWNLEDSGNTINIDGQAISYTWTATGTYTVTLQVSDDDGGISTDSTTVEVNGLVPFAWLGTSYALLRRKLSKMLRSRIGRKPGERTARKYRSV